MSNEKVNISELFEKSKLFAYTEISEPPICLTIQNTEHNSIFGTLGNFSVITGRAKSRKTFFVSAIVGATLLNKEYLRIKPTFPENKKRVLYIDTEQSYFHAKKVLSRISKICNLNENEHHENLIFCCLRGNNGAKMTEIIEFALKQYTDIGLLIIDGVKDLVTSINDEREATATTTNLMKWSANYNVHIITVLHKNKNDENLRGHLGSEMINKAESVLAITKSQDISTIESVIMRDLDIEKYNFGISENNIPYETEILIKENSTKKKLEPKQINKEIHQEVLIKVFEKKKIFSYGELVEEIQTALKTFGYEYGNTKCKDFLTFYKENKYISELDTKKDEKYYLSINEIPF